MLQFEEALARVLAGVPAPAIERIPLSEASGRALADGLTSPVDLPIFNNSTMDGYAVRAADIAAARPEAPARLRLTGRVAAGDTFTGQVTPATCVRLFTGSPVPAGADAVVMQEATRVEAALPDEVLVLEPVSAGENVRFRGEDVRRGSTLVQPGEILGPGQLGLLAATGVAEVQVGRQPSVGVLATGSELTEPGRPLAPGRIYESNRVALAAAIADSGGVPKIFPPVADALSVTSLALADAFNRCDVVVTSGGVSVGEMDFLKRSFEEIGGTLEFWKIAIKPGRPFVFGRYRSGLLFGLPGNPVSALVTFLLLVRPALLRWQGAADVHLPSHPGVLAEPLENDGERRHFLRVRVDVTGKVFSTGLQASHVLSSLAAANGLVDVPPRTTLPAGMSVPVLRWGF